MQKQIVVKSTVGLHASLAAKVVQAASKYSVDINLHYHNKVIDVKSILGLMSLAIPRGENVIIEATGDQAEAAINDIATILEK
ncbi:MAG: HPr family phosphocarrier protein [Anaeroplasmataceae bacterium]|nr:HPr family phosphocarrier protein [Anaeroplasma bactoclasticum]MCM1195997.1 HPr family phosphocarrier protein [Roseburia sp.]MDE5547267.1 HPr family phosphocarrier protein [Anaeroplasmataceae bacterium]MCM1556827.1 HPr family phosphocarrier protein [Anaeroplasma bactoclasticum]MDE5856025.1 HPr family phosphocarrier protein [Anaeroplasmataceae bacterium]